MFRESFTTRSVNTIGVMKEGARLRLRVLFVYGMGYSARAADLIYRMGNL